MGQLLKMINDLGDELRSDAAKKFVPLDTFDIHVRKNDDEHKALEQDNNHACLRLKMLEEWRVV